MKIALYQGPEQSGDVARNLELLDAMARAAADRGARLLICAELFLTGYNIGAAAVHRLAEPADGPAAQQASGVAREVGIAVLYGYPERVGEDVYNAAQLIDRDGRRLANYRKSHLFGEIDRQVFRPGDGSFVQATLDGMRLGILICYDTEFPEAVRAHALAGVEFVAIPTALMRPYEIVANTLVPARAYENQVFVAYVNRCGREGELEYCGLSCAVAPDGTDLARAGEEEELLVADLDIALHRDTRAPNTYLQDRRPELYAALTMRPDSHRPGQRHNGSREKAPR
jgi:predicted amidohydrolase